MTDRGPLFAMLDQALADEPSPAAWEPLLAAFGLSLDELAQLFYEQASRALRHSAACWAAAGWPAQ